MYVCYAIVLLNVSAFLVCVILTVCGNVCLSDCMCVCVCVCLYLRICFCLCEFAWK